MGKLRASLIKEMLLLRADKVGLLFMFALPIMLVVLLTLVQHNAFQRINENKITMLLVNNDKGEAAQKYVNFLYEAGLFVIEQDNAIDLGSLKTELLNRNKLTALYIPHDFSEKLIEKSEYATDLLLADIMQTENPVAELGTTMPELTFVHDPTLQEAYSFSIVQVLHSYINILENTLMLESIFQLTETNDGTEKFMESIKTHQVSISWESASAINVKPNTTQHNVPAWTIFAMFFMVVSLGNNIVKERLNGSFVRLKTVPSSFSLIMGSKMLVYMAAAFIQAGIIFSTGVFLFPLMKLPALVMPESFFWLVAQIVITAFSAVSFAMMLGALSKTQEQANGIGAISILFFAALGGILVPVFVMPDYIQQLSKFSPLYWSLEGFYFLFLKGGNYVYLLKTMMPLVLFVTICQSVTYIELRAERGS